MINLDSILDSYIKDDEKIILACSAGPDSMFLFYKFLDSVYKKNLIVCYFNHKTRIQTDEEESFLKELSKKNWVIFESKCLDIKDELQKSKSISFEELARIKRYELLNEIKEKYNSNYILTAHHLDDKIETFFFNLLRWTKLTGLINMKLKSFYILRPLINLEKNDILDYLDKNNLKYFIDETNFDTNITRNFLRHEILENFKKINKNYKKNISNLIEYFDEIKTHIDCQVLDFLNNQKIENSFSINSFNNLSDFMKKEIIRYIFFKSNCNSTIWLSKSNIDEIIRFINWKNNKTKKEIKELKMKKDWDYIFF